MDDDPAVAHAVQRDLRRRYPERCQVLSADAGETALDLVRQATLRAATPSRCCSPTSACPA